MKICTPYMDSSALVGAEDTSLLTRWGPRIDIKFVCFTIWVVSSISEGRL